MAIVGVSITKTQSFRGAAQPFGNTYYYQTPLPVTEGVADGLITAVADKEKAIHGGGVSFVYGRCWSAGGTKSENQMLKQKPLTGGGAGSNPVAGQDRERAFLVRARAGSDSRGNPVYLRKWWHLSVGFIGGATVSQQALENTAQLTTAQRAALVAAFDDLKQITSLPQVFTLVAESGRQITGDTVAHPYLEHRQLGDQWRGG